MSLSETRWLRRVSGAAMVVAPLVIVVAELLHAPFETDAAKQLAAVVDHPDRWYAAHILVLAGLVLAVPAYLGLAHLARRRRPTFARVGIGLFTPGVVALAAVVGMELVLWEIARADGGTGAMIDLVQRVQESPGLAPVYTAVLLSPLAWVVVGVALYLTRVVPVWAAVLIGIAQPVGFAAELAGAPKVVAVAAQVAFAVGLVPVGLSVLRQSDDAWESVREPPDLSPARAGG